MDFGRPLLKQDGIASRSNIRLIPEEEENPSDGPELSLDNRLIRAANRAAIDLLGELGDASLYPDYSLEQSLTIKANDLVVVFESFDNLNFVYAQPDAVFSNCNGVFSHNDFIGKPWGSKIRSKSHSGYGFLYLLKPTPELWARSLKHRTQIIHELDASMIIFQLYLRPNMTVVESGTGSGSLSHALLRTLAPHGHLHTFEFHQPRYETAMQEFQQHSLSHLVTCHLQDVCAFGFGLSPQSVNAVVLDLPEPWLAVPHAAFCLERGGRIASYSPCMEQSQRTIQVLNKCGFHSIKTYEYRLREHYVDNVGYDMPPDELRPGRRERIKQDENAEESLLESLAPNEVAGGRVAQQLQHDEDDKQATQQDNHVQDSKQQQAPSRGTKRKQMLCARPFSTMRGHTAFLTFATAGNVPQPDPNQK